MEAEVRSFVQELYPLKEKMLLSSKFVFYTLDKKFEAFCPELLF